ncbi:Putative N-acetylgalactosaminyl-diphosphoundecaprenol glucuronosyltransferase [Indibacter alkaliphilus LW1]|uniref:N-acetylgalactosaminyl-diphosphoundecaprenol glucuronosyltransferase n=1 Tax=Indibacter alkaliphilus (strain CCUG 57479 / KCTC 22604 / LW1) TaxID=1189612 RepID=S2D9U8_INDAL|nr:Putative N-acetylgalactosaminyl-diphosphoundecaprenol glucuronosyltransferase [Indibacter alkaliphilus LW1]
MRETLDSVLSQTYTHWECIIVDDHSTDHSWKILEEYAKKDSRVKVFKRPDDRTKGGSVARNYAFELSKGEFIQWLDSDDIIHPIKIENQLQDLLSVNLNAISISNWDWFDQLGEIEKKLENSNFSSSIRARWQEHPKNGLNLILWLFKNNLFIPSHSYIMSREVILKSGLWNEGLYKNQDGEFMLRALLKSDQVVFNDSVYAFYRRPDSSHLSKQATSQSYNDWFRSLVLGDQKILEVQNSKEIRNILIMNYERLIKFTGLDFPQVTQMALERINVLNPKVKFDLSKPYLIWLGSWVGFRNFLKMRDFLIGLKLLKI